MKKMKLSCGADDPECGLSTGESALLLPDGPRILSCDICCTEAGFCRECRCLLCGLKIQKEERDRYEWIQCRQLVGAGKSAGMCGHSSHLECALDCRMAGVMNGEDGELMLDAEYLCRRCDKKSDMECHLVLLVQAAQQGTRAVAERGLKLALRVMQGTTRSGIKGLEMFIDKVTQEAEKGDDIRVVFDEYRNQALAADAAKRSTRGMHQSEASFDQWLPPCAEYLAAPRNVSGISAAGAINNSSSTNASGGNFGRSNDLTKAALASQPTSNFINTGKEYTPGFNSAVGAVSSMSLCGDGQHSGAASFPTIVKKEPGEDLGRSTALKHTVLASHPPNLSTHIIDNGEKCRASGTACVVSSISPCSVEQKQQLEASLIPTLNASDMLSLPVDLLTLQYKKEISEALKKLKESQRQEYKNAKERLYSQMERVLAQYNQLEEEKKGLAHSSISSLEVFDELMERTLIQFAGLKNERDNFELMLAIGNGYGSISQDTLGRLFEWPQHSEKLDR